VMMFDELDENKQRQLVERVRSSRKSSSMWHVFGIVWLWANM
jgi:hypothetical protein